MPQLFPIGRFSQMTRLSVKALRHYDTLGLLVPAEVDPSSGYRYYTGVQARRAEAIRLLRAVDLPLGDIATVLDTELSRDVVVKILDEHRARLDDQLRLDQHRLAAVRRLIEGEDPIMPYEITTKTVEPVTILSARRHTDLAGVGRAIGEGMGLLMAAVTGAGGEVAGPPMVLYPDVIDTEQSGAIECALPVAAPIQVDGETIICRELPAGPVATTVHHGEYTEIATAYHVLEGWMTAHGHQPAGPPREIYLNDPGEVSVAEQRTEVQWPFA